MGEFLKDLLKARHINISSLAAGMKPKAVSANAIQKHFTSRVVSDEVLLGLTEALGWDLYSIVKNEQAKRMAPHSLTSKEAEGQLSSEPMVSYQRRPGSASDKGMVLMINLDEYEEIEQLRLLKYLNNAPKKGQSQRTAI